MMADVTRPVRLRYGSMGKPEEGCHRDRRRSLDARLAPRMLSWWPGKLTGWVLGLDRERMQEKQKDVPGAPGEELWEWRVRSVVADPT